jgi:hypothetical protein
LFGGFMALIPDAVPEEALDDDEIFRRGGTNCGDEDFALCKRPHCGQVYLIEYEVDALYLDATNLDRRLGVNIGVSGFNCENCGGAFPKKTPWIGKKAPTTMQVTWQNLGSSTWRWVTARTK